MVVPLTVIFFSGNGDVAGPFLTEPSLAENLLKWQPQLIVPPDTSATVQPWWVHVALNALNCPALGWVITTSAAATTTPPPTGTSVVLGRELLPPALPLLPPALPLLPPALLLLPLPAPLFVPLSSPQAAITETVAMPAAPASTALRVVSLI